MSSQPEKLLLFIMHGAFALCNRLFLRPDRGYILQTSPRPGSGSIPEHEVPEKESKE